MTEFEYSWFVGKEVGSGIFEMYAPVPREDGSFTYLLLEQGTQYTHDFSTEIIVGDILRLSFTYDVGAWPSEDWAVFPRPLPFDPKYPRGSVAGSPYGDSQTYKSVLDSLQSTVPLKRAFLDVENLVDGDLADAFDSFKQGTVADYEASISKIRDWIAGNLGSSTVQSIEDALPSGLSRAGGYNLEERDWYPLGWEVKTIYGFFGVLELP